MTQDQLIALSIVGAAELALVVAAFLLLFPKAMEQEIARRIGGLRPDATITQHGPWRFWTLLASLVRRFGDALRGRMLSNRDAEGLARTLAASGFDPPKAMPFLVGAKFACMFSVPALVYLGTVLLGFPAAQQVIWSGLSVAVAMLLPNWAIALVRRRYQRALRYGIPDALDLLVVCAEAGLGLDSALDRVAREMKKSNRAVGVEFSLLTDEMRIMPDRRIALANLAERTGQPALKRLAGTIAQTLKYGTPLSHGLRTLAAEMRGERMIQFEERAGRLPALLVLPMILLILPCLFIILMGEPLTRLVGTFAGMY